MTWALGALLATIALAFLLKGLGGTSGSATVSVGTTLLGPAWIGFGLGFVLLLRDIPEHGRLAAFTLLLAVFSDDTFAYVGGRAARPPQARAGAVAGKDPRGLPRRHRRLRLRDLRLAVPRPCHLPVDRPGAPARRSSIAAAAPGRRPVRVDAQARHVCQGHRASSSAATAACSTGSTRSSSPRSRATT